MQTLKMLDQPEYIFRNCVGVVSHLPPTKVERHPLSTGHDSVSIDKSKSPPYRALSIGSCSPIYDVHPMFRSVAAVRPKRLLFVNSLGALEITIIFNKNYLCNAMLLLYYKHNRTYEFDIATRYIFLPPIPP